MSDETIKYPVKLCYIGKRLNPKGKLLSVYLCLAGHDLDEIPNDGKSANIKNPRLRLYKNPNHIGIGVIYTYDETDKRILHINTKRDRDIWSNREDVETWSAIDRVEKAKFEEDRLDNKLRDNDAFLGAMSPLQQMYKKLPFNQRLAFQVMVTHYLEMEPKKTGGDYQ